MGLTRVRQYIRDRWRIARGERVTDDELAAARMLAKLCPERVALIENYPAHYPGRRTQIFVNGGWVNGVVLGLADGILHQTGGFMVSRWLVSLVLLDEPAPPYLSPRNRWGYHARKEGYRA